MFLLFFSRQEFADPLSESIDYHLSGFASLVCLSVWSGLVLVYSPTPKNPKRKITEIYKAPPATMADNKVDPAAAAPVVSDSKDAAAFTPPLDEEDVQPREFQRPQGWMYKQHKLLAWKFPWYASPKTQLGMVAFVCFLCPGMFNALSGLGGGGKADATLADDMVSAGHT